MALSIVRHGSEVKSFEVKIGYFISVSISELLSSLEQNLKRVKIDDISIESFYFWFVVLVRVNDHNFSALLGVNVEHNIGVEEHKPDSFIFVL